VPRGQSALALLVVAGCGVNNPTYFPPMGPLEVGAMGMPGEATTVVTLPFRPPDATETQALDQASTTRGFRIPWLRRDSVALSISYTIANLDDAEGNAQVLINGASELASYDRDAIAMAAQMAAVNNEAEDVLSLIEVTPVTVEPHHSVAGQVREDDFAEAELDLDAIGRWTAAPAAVLINASEVNPVGLENVPPDLVVPAMFQLAVTFTATTHMRLDFLVRVRDKDGQLLGAGGADAFAPSPVGYMPPVPAAP
jgi:hypothetical protein